MKNKGLKRVFGHIIYYLIAVAFLLVVWVVTAKIKNNPLVVPLPSATVKRFFRLFGEKNFWQSIGKTVLRSLLCFVASFLVALAMALIAYKKKAVGAILTPIIAFLRSAPTVAVILILYAFFSSFIMIQAVGFLIAFPVMYSQIGSRLDGMDENLFIMAKVYKVPKRRIFSEIVLPFLAPTLFDTACSTLSLTVKVVVSAEILTSANIGIGGKIQTAYASFEIEYLLAWTFVAVLIAFLLETAVLLIKKIIVRQV